MVISLSQRLKKENLGKRLVVLEEDYQKLECQRREKGDADEKNRLQSKLNTKLEEIKEIEKELNQINEEINEERDNKLINILNDYIENYEEMKRIYQEFINYYIERRTNTNKDYRDANELINSLNYPHESKYKYIEKFVAYLYCLENKVSTELKNKLYEWISEYIDGWEQLFKESKEEISKLEEKQKQQCYPVPMVAISERGEGYVLEAWLLKNLAQDKQFSPSDFVQLTIDEKSEIKIDKDLNDLPKLLKQVIAKSYNKCQKSIKQIHVFLPAKLMNYTVDSCKNWQGEEEDENDEYATTIGEDYEVLLRCSERLRGNSPLVIKWRDKAEIFKSKLIKLAEEIFILGDSDNPKSLFKKLKSDDETLAVRIMTVFKHKEPGTLLLNAGIPIALWIRQQLPEIKNQSLLDNILKGCCLGKVPNKVKQQRINAFDCEPPESHIGRHLCLLWDDPNILPPEQKPTQKKL
ncbi:MAG: hypothetical protein AAF757_09010 [Cyanobacteria bacterium P01_D01_bin.116]